MLNEFKKMTSQQITNHIGSELRRFRLQANIVSAGDVAIHLGMGENTIYSNEQGKYLITKSALISLFDLYGMKQTDRDTMLNLRQLVIDKRKEEKGE